MSRSTRWKRDLLGSTVLAMGCAAAFFGLQLLLREMQDDAPGYSQKQLRSLWGENYGRVHPLAEPYGNFSLPAWQQELLSDPGWNQPYQQRPETPDPVPSYEELRRQTKEVKEKPVVEQPRIRKQGQGR